MAEPASIPGGPPAVCLSPPDQAEKERREEGVRLRAALASLCAGRGIVRLHNLRAICAGRHAHVDAQIAVPMFRDVIRAHDATDAFERRVIQGFEAKGETVLPTDACRQLSCAQCDLPACPARGAPFRARPALAVEETVHPDPPFVLQP